MKYFTLNRVAYASVGTYGVLLDEGHPFCLTVERRWLGNIKNKSCIPVGKYICLRKVSPKFGETFEVLEVPNRTHILFHKGNLMEDSHGCIIIGEQFGHPTLGEDALFSSGVAFKEFMERLHGQRRFILEIKESEGN